MANKKAILNQLADFFAKQGKVLTPSEYKALGADAPMRFMAATVMKTFIRLTLDSKCQMALTS